MKPLSCAIVASLVFATITIPALQAKADETTIVNDAWQQGYTAGLKVAKECTPTNPPADPSVCQFANPYKLDENDVGNEAKALSNADYIAGFIAGKSAGASQ